MKIDVSIAFKDGTELEAKGITFSGFLAYLNEELTLTSGYHLYRSKGNVICGELLDSEVRSIDLHILPDES